MPIRLSIPYDMLTAPGTVHLYWVWKAGIIVEERMLIDLARQGNMTALEAIVGLYDRKIYNFCYRAAGNREDALDLAQDTFMRVCASINGFRGEAPLSAWIYRIANNACVDYIRRKNRCRHLSLDAKVDGEEGDLSWQIGDCSPGPQEIAEFSALKQGIMSGIRSLSAEHRTVLIMHDIQELTYEEIAGAVECPMGTVKSRLNRARTALKRRLFDEGLIGHQRCPGSIPPEEMLFVKHRNNLHTS